jgi:signal transduction histidine kinase
MNDKPSKKIHIIDDDLNTIHVLRFVLQSKGYEVFSSNSGKEALDEFKENIPDLILLDIVMPEMDGYQVCYYLKSISRLKDIPVIFITASHDTTELVKGFDAGGVDFISKPINRSELLARVNTHLELKQSRDVIAQKNYELGLEIESRKQAEEKFRALSETAFEAVLFLQGYKIIEFNKAAQQLFSLFQPTSKILSINDLTDEKGKDLLKKIFRKKDKSGVWELTFFNQQKGQFYGMVQYQSFVYKGENVNVLAIRDITRQKEIDNEIFNAIIDAEEKERKRFSRDMHDGLGALLSTLKIYVGLMQKENKNAAEKEFLIAEMKDTINKAVESARTIANNIMPSVLMDHGLLKALKSFIDALNKTGVVDVEFSYSAKKIGLPSHTETHLYRIILELINNTLKHANASKIDVHFDCANDFLTIRYYDNGDGFDYDKIHAKQTGSQGLKNILSRSNFINGNVTFKTSPGKGLYFNLEVPIKN